MSGISAPSTTLNLASVAIAPQTSSPTISVVQPISVKQRYPFNTGEEIQSILANLRSGQPISSSPKQIALAAKANNAAKKRKTGSREWSASLAKDLAEGID
jgi:hypothetical protein